MSGTHYTPLKGESPTVSYGAALRLFEAMVKACHHLTRFEPLNAEAVAQTARDRSLEEVLDACDAARESFRFAIAKLEAAKEKAIAKRKRARR